MNAAEKSRRMAGQKWSQCPQHAVQSNLKNHPEMVVQYGPDSRCLKISGKDIVPFRADDDDRHVAPHQFSGQVADKCGRPAKSEAADEGNSLSFWHGIIWTSTFGGMAMWQTIDDSCSFSNQNHRTKLSQNHLPVQYFWPALPDGGIPLFVYFTSCGNKNHWGNRIF